MKFKIIYLLSLTLLFFSCLPDSKEERSARDNYREATPEVLVDERKSKLDYISRNRDRGILSMLYREALEKDESLKRLDEKIRAMPGMKYDSLKQLSEYKNTNTTYWKGAMNEIRGIKDSILRKSTYSLFQKLESDYKLRMSKLDEKEQQINALQRSLGDQEALMRVIITQPMIQNYQKNEMPDIQSLEALIDRYESLIEETKQIIQ